MSFRRSAEGLALERVGRSPASRESESSRRRAGHSLEEAVGRDAVDLEDDEPLEELGRPVVVRPGTSLVVAGVSDTPTVEVPESHVERYAVAVVLRESRERRSDVEARTWADRSPLRVRMPRRTYPRKHLSEGQRIVFGVALQLQSHGI